MGILKDYGNVIHYGDKCDYQTRIVLGNIPGHNVMNGLGERQSMGATPAGEDIWRGNELSPAPTSHVKIPYPPDVGEQMTVVSESVNDIADGSGARTVMIHYLDANGVDSEENITLNGTTPVDTVATNIRFVNDFHVTSTGTGLVTAGHVKIYSKADSGLVYNMIATGGNKSLVPHRMVPANHTLVVKNWHATEAKGKRCAFRLRSTDMHAELMPGVFLFKDTAYLNNSASGSLSVNFAVPGLSVIKVTGWPDISGAEGSCSWRGILIQHR
jgi:hypothetical protein